MEKSIRRGRKINNNNHTKHKWRQGRANCEDNSIEKLLDSLTLIKIPQSTLRRGKKVKIYRLVLI